MICLQKDFVNHVLDKIITEREVTLSVDVIMDVNEQGDEDAETNQDSNET